MIAYFVNQYPGISHSFIRREIQALERAGVDIARFAIRPSGDAVISREDSAEAEKTRHIIGTAPLALAGSMLKTLIRSPIRAVSAFADALRMGHCSEAGLFRHILYFGEALVLADWLRAEKAAHVHAHFGTNAAFIAMLASDLADTQYSITVHGPEEFEKAREISLREKTERSAFTVAISRYGAAQLKKITDPDCWRKIKIVRCGIEQKFFEGAASAQTPDNRFVCVGRLCAEKGQIDLVRAAVIARQQIPTLEIDLIGDGPMRSAIEKIVADAGAAAYVRLLGWKTPTQVRAALEDAKGFVLPSYAEGLPVSIMEAMSLRRPVISTYIAGIPELVRDGETGWLIPAGDVDALAAALVSVSSATPAQIDKITDEGFRRVRAFHDIDKEAAALATHFADAAARR